jgi:hypothetical protein
VRLLQVWPLILAFSGIGSLHSISIKEEPLDFVLLHFLGACHKMQLTDEKMNLSVSRPEFLSLALDEHKFMDNLNSIWDQLTVISSRTVTPSELTTEAVTVRIWSTSRSRCPPPSSPEIISAFLSHLNLGKEILPNFSSTAPRLSISLKIPSEDLPRLLSAPARFQIPGKATLPSQLPLPGTGKSRFTL